MIKSRNSSQGPFSRRPTATESISAEPTPSPTAARRTTSSARVSMKNIMDRQIFALALTCSLLALQLVGAAPAPQNDIDDGYGGGGQGNVDYNTVVGHFKDFFMYLPVMMTTLKETMTGFPKFAEGLRILTSKTGRLDEDCGCKQGSNEHETNSRFD